MIYGISKENIYKAAIDYTIEKNHQKIFEFLSKDTKKEDIASQQEKIQRLKDESKLSKEKIASLQLKKENKGKIEKTETYKMFLLSLTEKSRDLKFFDINEYEEE